MRLSLATLVLVMALAGCGGAGRAADPASAYRRGVEYYKEGKYGRALAYFQAALAEAPATAQALNFAGVCALYEGNHDRALDYFNQALLEDASYVPARFNLGLAQLEDGQASEAIGHLRQVKLADAPPANIDYYLGRAYLDQSAWRQAQEALTSHLASHPATAETLNTLGVIEVRLGRYDEAEQTFSRAIDTEPDFAAAHLNLGLVQQHHFRRPAKARAHYERYLDLAATDELDKDLRRRLQAEIRQLAAAPPAPPAPEPSPAADPPQRAEAARSSPPPAPSEPEKPARTSQAPPSRTPVAPAPAVAPTVKRRSPVTPIEMTAGNRGRATSLFNRGVQQHQRGELTAAIDAYQQAIAADPTFASAYYNLAICFRARGNPTRSLEYYERALQANPRYTDARFNYAIGLQEQGYLPDAINQYEQLLVANPNEAAAHLSLAGLYARDPAQRRRAREHYQAYLRLKPDSPAARDIRRWLARNR